MIILADLGWVKRSAHVLWFLVILTILVFPSRAVARNVTLAWDPSGDPTVAGYKVYCGTVSRTYTNIVDTGSSTSVTISNLMPGMTYYFAATTYTVAGLESDYSAEAPYTVPAPTNAPPINPPTLDAIADVTINQNAGPQTVNLTGISAGVGNSGLSLAVNALSSNPGLIPNPTINYTSPNATGSLTFSAASNSYGVATMTVMVDDSAASNNTVIRSFTVTVNQPAGVPAPLTNAIVAPNTTFRYQINPPYQNGDRFSYSLGIGAPSGAQVSTAHGLTYLTWTPTTEQALTTNLISIVVTDKTHSNLSTNQTVMVTVLDFAGVRMGAVSVAAGQSALLPVYVSSSSGLTNLSFTVDWPASGFNNPTLLISAPGIAVNSLQNHQTNLVVN
ncbi:MAG TPA: fibronectin type III domain-containing protein, partial [Verrucomicrobiae bacterium]|nr:fibronectin type III domain-containing protein [Verrucomicrobiae bacterium]